MTLRPGGGIAATRAAAVGVVGVGASPALGQLGKDKRPRTTQPGSVGGSAGNRGNTQPIPKNAIIDHVKPHDWVVDIQINLHAPSTVEANKRVTLRNFDFTSASIVFPVLKETGSSVLSGDFAGKLFLQNVDQNVEPTLLANFHSGTQLANWKLTGWTGTDITVQATLPITCYETIYDDRAAEALGWPAAWPAVAASTFEPQSFVDIDPFTLGKDGKPSPYDMTVVKDLLKKWTKGQDPKKLKPAVLAKYLAGQVMREIQINGSGLQGATTGELEGFILQGAPKTLLDRRGSEFDQICALAAVYRMAGLPARTVIGWDTEGDDRGSFLGKRASGSLRGWVEFALVDGKGALVWIPVDIARMRKSSPVPPPLSSPWPFFGSHKELDEVAPIAFQFLPPTTVVSSGAPAFYGWLVTPAPPQFQVTQVVRVNMITASKRGGETVTHRKPGEPETPKE
jgi:hypothetical protein